MTTFQRGRHPAKSNYSIKSFLHVVKHFVVLSVGFIIPCSEESIKVENNWTYNSLWHSHLNYYILQGFQFDTALFIKIIPKLAVFTCLSPIDVLVLVWCLQVNATSRISMYYNWTRLAGVPYTFQYIHLFERHGNTENLGKLAGDF